LKSDDTSNNHFLNRISSASYFHQVWGLVSLLSPLEFTIALFMDQTSPQSNQVRQFGLRIASCPIQHLLKWQLWLFDSSQTFFGRRGIPPFVASSHERHADHTHIDVEF